MASITGYDGYELKRIMRTGTVATIDNRNWELRDHKEPVERLSQSRRGGARHGIGHRSRRTASASGCPMAPCSVSRTNRCMGELKLPGMASSFYTQQVQQHLKIGIKAMESLRKMPVERLHSRKLRSFAETAFQ